MQADLPCNAVDEVVKDLVQATSQCFEAMVQATQTLSGCML